QSAASAVSIQSHEDSHPAEADRFSNAVLSSLQHAIARDDDAESVLHVVGPSIPLRPAKLACDPGASRIHISHGARLGCQRRRRSTWNRDALEGWRQGDRRIY